jgi:hypothetical protein
VTTFVERVLRSPLLRNGTASAAELAAALGVAQRVVARACRYLHSIHRLKRLNARRNARWALPNYNAEVTA